MLTLFLQFQLVCSGCPSSPNTPGDAPWICDHCYYKHPDPVDDPFYQSTVKNLMYFCATVLIFVSAMSLSYHNLNLIFLKSHTLSAYGFRCAHTRPRSGRTLSNFSNKWNCLLTPGCRYTTKLSTPRNKIKPVALFTENQAMRRSTSPVTPLRARRLHCRRTPGSLGT